MKKFQFLIYNHVQQACYEKLCLLENANSNVLLIEQLSKIYTISFCNTVDRITNNHNFLPNLNDTLNYAHNKACLSVMHCLNEGGIWNGIKAIGKTIFNAAVKKIKNLPKQARTYVATKLADSKEKSIFRTWGKEVLKIDNLNTLKKVIIERGIFTGAIKSKFDNAIFGSKQSLAYITGIQNFRSSKIEIDISKCKFDKFVHLPSSINNKAEELTTRQLDAYNIFYKKQFRMLEFFKNLKALFCKSSTTLYTQGVLGVLGFINGNGEHKNYLTNSANLQISSNFQIIIDDYVKRNQVFTVLDFFKIIKKILKERFNDSRIKRDNSTSDIANNDIIIETPLSSPKDPTKASEWYNESVTFIEASINYLLNGNIFLNKVAKAMFR